MIGKDNLEAYLTIDLSQEGLALVLKDYQGMAMKLLWNGSQYSSREVWEHVNNVLGSGVGRKTISRASVINFLNAMVDKGVLGFTEITGKGGYRRIYEAMKTEKEFWVWLINTADSKLKRAAGIPLH